MRLAICREYEFAAAHHLPLHDGKCKRPHGHNYKLEVEVTGPLQDVGPGSGMVLDFYLLDTMVEEYVTNVLDHQDLNVLAAGQFNIGYTTAENLSLWIYNRLRDVAGLNVRRVRLYETPRSYAEVTQ